MFSPDGTRLLSGSWDGTAKLWDTATGQLLRTFSWDTPQIRSVAWSPDGKTLAVGGEVPPRHFTAAELGRLQTAFERRDYSNFQIPEVANPPTDEVRLFNSDTGSLIRSTPDASAGVAFAPDRKEIALLSWEGLSILFPSGEQVTNKNGRKLDLRNVFYSKDGQQVASAGSNGVCVFDAHSAELQYIASDPYLFREHNLPEFAEHIRRMSDMSNQVLHDEEPAYLTRYWQELLPGFRPSSLFDQGMRNQRIAFSPDGKRAAILSGHFYNFGRRFAIGLEGIVVYHLVNQRVEWFFQSPNQKWIRTLSISPDGKLLAAAGDSQKIFLWDLESGREVSQIGNSPAKVHAVAFSPSEPYLAAGNGDGTLVLYNTQSGDPLVRNESCESSIVHLEFSPTSDAIVLGTVDGKIRMVDVPELQTVMELPAHRGRFLGGVFCHDGENYLSVGQVERSHRRNAFDQNAEVALWSLSSNSKLDELKFPDEIRVRSVAGSPDGNRLAIATTRRSWEWQTVDNGVSIKKRKATKITSELLLCDATRNIRCQLIYSDSEFPILEVAFTEDSSNLLMASEGYRMRVFNIDKERDVRSFIARRDGPTSFAVSSDGKKLVRGTAYRKEIEGFDLKTGKQTQEFIGHQNSINSLAISPDHQLIGSGSDDGTVKLWNATTSELMYSRIVES